MFFFFQAEDGIRDLVRSRGLGDVYKRQHVQAPGNRKRLMATKFSEITATDMRAAMIDSQLLSLIHI